MKCLIVDDEEMSRTLLEALVISSGLFRSVKKCASAREALTAIINEKVDVIFLDVEMPGMSGLQLLENISESSIQIILITSHEKYALQAFDFNVTDYIVKPIVEERFLKAVLKAKQKHTASKDATAEQDLFVKVNAGLVKINTMNILYLESMTNHVAIYTTNGRFVVHGTLKSMENKLSEDLFMRVHNSYIVRIDKIASIEENALIIDKTTIPVSRAHWKSFMQRLKMV